MEEALTLLKAREVYTENIITEISKTDNIHFQNIHTFTYQKALLHTLLLLVFQIVRSFQ